MKQLYIKNVNRYALVDDEYFQKCATYVWHYSPVRISTTINGRQVRIANFIVNDNNFEYDHKDRDPFNNQKENLRKCTRSQNQANRAKFSNCTSKYKGVNKVDRKTPYIATITVNYKKILLGSYKTELQAAKVYDRAAKEHFGEFAWLNFPEETK